jgi:hypothetical protein
MSRLTCAGAVLIFALGASAFGCYESRTPALERTERNLSAELDEVENEWIRLKAKAEGKSEVEQELRVAKDEIEEELVKVRAKVKEIERSQAKKEVDRDLEQGVSKLKQALKRAKEKLSAAG